jgi:hypothetical protein
MLGDMFSMRSVSKLHNQEQMRLRECLETEVRRVVVVRQSPASKDVNTEPEEATALEAVTARQPVKIQQTEKTSYVL